MSERSPEPSRPAPPEDREVGRVLALWRYPVKSMAAEGLREAELSWQGLAGDRRWAFVREGLVGSGFPWLTIRQRPSMSRYRPRLLRPERPDASGVAVLTPAGAELEVTDPALAVELGGTAEPIKQDRGVFDAMPLSLITAQSIAELGARLEAELDPLRFRPNLLVDAVGAGPFAEDSWIGSTLRIGGALIRIDKRDSRCVVVNVDPATSRRDPRVLRALGKERGGELGVYGSTVRPGVVRLGDPVVIEAPGGAPGNPPAARDS